MDMDITKPTIAIAIALAISSDKYFVGGITGNGKLSRKNNKTSNNYFWFRKIHIVYDLFKIHLPMW